MSLQIYINFTLIPVFLTKRQKCLSYQSEYVFSKFQKNKSNENSLKILLLKRKSMHCTFPVKVSTSKDLSLDAYVTLSSHFKSSTSVEELEV